MRINKKNKYDYILFFIIISLLFIMLSHAIRHIYSHSVPILWLSAI